MASYETMIANYEAVEKLGRSIALSGMFGASSVDQGIVIACDCYLNNMSPIEYQRRNKIMNGKPFKQYDAMLAEFHERGGESRIEEKSPEVASITLWYKEQQRTFTLTWEDAQKETFPYHVDKDTKESMVLEMLAKGEKPRLKAKYATPRSRAIMLFARVVSDALRSMCPEVNFGCYTPEEIDDIDSPKGAEPTKSESKPQAVVTQSPAPASEVTVAGVASQVVESVVASEVPAQEVLRDTDPINQALLEDIQSKIKQIRQNVPTIVDTIKEYLKAKGIEGLKGLTVAEGEKMLKVLGHKNCDEQFKAWLSKNRGEATTVSPT